MVHSRSLSVSLCSLIRVIRACPLIVVAELDGFQHGAEPLTPKCLGIACDRLEFSKQWVFNTGTLASRSINHLSTYHHQATFIHGFSLTSPGIPQDMFGRVFLHTMGELFFEVFQAKSNLPIPDHVLVFTKGLQKLEFLRQAVENTETTTRMQFRNLEELRCPRLDQPAPELRTRTVPTLTKAMEFSIWLADKGVC